VGADDIRFDEELHQLVAAGQQAAYVLNPVAVVVLTGHTAGSTSKAATDAIKDDLAAGGLLPGKSVNRQASIVNYYARHHAAPKISNVQYDVQ